MFEQGPLLDREFNRVYRTDWWLLLSVMILVATGCVMIASASYDFSLKNFGAREYLFHRHLVFLGVSVVACSVVVAIPVSTWQRFAPLLLVAAFVLLAVILIPGVGHSNKGATRWLQVGGLTLQVSEFVKFCLLVYLASYLVRQQALVRNTFTGFLNPLIVIAGLVVFFAGTAGLRFGCGSGSCCAGSSVSGRRSHRAIYYPDASEFRLNRSDDLQ